jgi:hypothetical protein
MGLTRKEAVNFLHNKGYSRRLSAKLVDVAFDAKTNGPMAAALKKGFEKVSPKKKVNIKLVIAK